MALKRIALGVVAAFGIVTADSAAPREDMRKRQALTPLPLGAITARGWMRTTLERSRDGMGGHYGEFDPDQFEKPGLTKDYDAKLPGATWVKNGEMPGWCAEMSGEYRLGQLELAATLDDAGLKAKFALWRDSLLRGQEPDGYLGAYRPQDNRQEDYNAWGAHFYYRALLLDYSRTRDAALLDALHRGLLWFCENWRGDRKTDYAAPTIIWPMVETYRLTGDPRLLAFCEDYRRFLNARAQWNPRRSWTPNQTGGFEALSLEERAYHVVAYAVRAQLPGILYLGNGDGGLLAAAKDALDGHLANVGWQPTGAPVSDMEHTSRPSCVGETEYCNFLAWMEYMQWLARLSGEARYGDLIERMAFNAAMGARKKDERAIAYNSSPNQFRATKTSARAGCKEYYEVYCPCEFAACCSAQSIRLVPSYLLKSVMRDGAGDLAFFTYGPCRVDAGEVVLDVETDYPFGDEVRVHVKATGAAWNRALRFRRPGWAVAVAATRNGVVCEPAEERGWLVLPGPWTDDALSLTFTRRPVIRAMRERTLEEPLRTVEYGPLVFAQPLPTKWTETGSDPTSRPLPPGWPWYEATCAAKPTLYALPESVVFHPESIQVRTVKTAGYPWEDSPLRLVVPMARATAAYAPDPEAQVKNPAPQRNPAPLDEGAGIEAVELVPYGATNLRVTCFPVGREHR